MKLFLKIAASFLLLSNGITAVYGGLNMIIYPDGSKIHLSLDLLEYSFFESYLIPGIVLVIINGFSSLYAFASLGLKLEKYCQMVVLQGIILIGWLVVQISLIRLISYWHLVMLVAGVSLIVIGIFLNDIENKKHAEGTLKPFHIRDEFWA